MAETETVRRILISGRSEGLDKLSSELNKIRDAHEGVAEAAETSATITERSARRQLSAQGAWDRQIARADAAVRAQQQFDRELNVAARAFDNTVAGVAAYSAEIERLQRRLEAVGGTLARGSPGLDAFLGIGRAPKARDDTIAVFEAQTRELQAAAERRAALLKKPLENINKLITALPVSNTAGQGPAEQSMAVFAAQMDKTAAAVQRLKQQFDPLAVAEERHAAAVAEAIKLEKAGELSAKSRDTIIVNSTKILNDTKKAYEGAFTAQNKFGTGAGLARHELINLSRQMQDIGVSLASGQSFVTVLIQQGTQVADIFASSRGSVGGFLKELPNMLLAAAPAAAAVAAGIAAIAAAYVAFNTAAERQTLSNSTLGAGRISGVSGSDLNSMAEQAATAASITVSASRSIAAEYTRLGPIVATQLTRMTQLTKDYSLVTGQDLKTASQDMAKALADPEKGVALLTEKLGALDNATLMSIRTALSYNDTLRAQKLLLDAVAQATDGAANAQSAWDRLKSAVANEASNMANSAAKNILGPDTKDQLTDLERRAAALRKNIAEGRMAVGKEPEMRAQLSTYDRQISELQKVLDTQNRVTAARQKSAEVNKTIGAAEAVGMSATQKSTLGYQLAQAAVVKYEQSLEQLKAQRDDLAKGQDVNGRVSRETIALTTQIRDQEKGLEAAKKQLSDYRVVTQGLTVDEERARRVQEAREKGVTAHTRAEKEAAAAELARAETYGQALNVTQQLAAEEAKRKDIAIDAKRQNADAVRTSGENVATIKAETNAIMISGEIAAKVARMKLEAQREFAQTGIDSPEIILQRKIREEIAATEKASAEAARRSRDNAAAVNGSLGAGVSPRQRADREELRRVEQQIAKEKEAGLVVDAKGVQLQQQRLDGVKAEQAARSNAAASDYVYQQETTLKQLAKQIEMIQLTRGARYEELEIMKAQQFMQEQGIDAESDRGKEIRRNAILIGQQTREYENQLKIQNQIRQAQEFAADSVKSFIGDLLTGTEGLTGALKNLGKSFLNSSLDALISGKGPLAGITGLASADKDGQGGFIGLLTKGLGNLGKSVEVGAKKGTTEGTVTGMAVVANTGGEGWLAGIGISGKDLAGGLTAIVGLAGAYGAGAAAGSYGQAVGGGAISGGMAGLALAGTGIGASLGGAAVLGPIGLIVGGALAYWGQKSAREAAKKAREEEAQANYKQAEPGIAVLRSQLRGEAQDTLENRIKNTLTEVQKGIDVAFFAKKIEEANALAGDYFAYKDKSITDFQRAFDGLISSLEEGLGPNSAFSQARDNVKATGDSLKGFVSDAAYAFGKESVQVQQATEAAKTHALSILDGAKSLSLVETRMEEIRGAGAALQTLLVELGMSATEAAKAIEQDTIAALKRLAKAFQDDINSQINESQGYGYVNEFNTLFADIASKMASAAALGLDTTSIQTLFQSKAQEIVDGSQIAGEAFDRLIAGFPQLAGVIVEFTDGLRGAAKEADIAARKLAYLDRLFAATNDTTTLEGQLAAYNRTAQRERQEEIRKGGQALIELDAAQAAERYNIIRDWNQKILDEQKNAANEAKTFWERFAKSIKQYTDSLRAGTESPLSPQQRLAAAQSQYNAQLALAQTGDRDALNGITGYHGDFMDALRDFWGSSQTFQDLWQSSITDLEALPNQVRPEDLIVDAIEAGAQQTVDAIAMMQQVLKASVDSGSAQQTAIALQGYFTKLDTNTDAALSYAEFVQGIGPLATQSEQQAARSIFNNIDADGNGMISKQEATNAALIGTGSVKSAIDATTTQLLALAQIVGATQNTANLVAQANSYLGGQGGIVQNTADTVSGLGTEGYLDNIYERTVVMNNNLATANLRSFVQGSSPQYPAYYAEGGWTGPGTKYQPAGVVHADEYVFSKAQTNRLGLPFLDALANDNLALPTVAMPTFMNSGNDNIIPALLSQLIDATDASRKENSKGHTQTARATLAGASQVREGVDDLEAAQAEMARVARRKRAVG